MSAPLVSHYRCPKCGLITLSDHIEAAKEAFAHADACQEVSAELRSVINTLTDGQLAKLSLKRAAKAAGGA